MTYDLVVIGGGSAGVRCSRIAAGLGARVALVEERRLGGTCVNVGCVPKKLYTYAADFAHQAEDARGFGWEVPRPALDWGRFVAGVRGEVSRLNGVYGRLLDRAGVEVVRGRAVVAGPHAVRVGDRVLDTRHIVVATGGWPWKGKVLGNEHAITSNEIFDLAARPDRAVIVGGGYVAIEFASILNGFGTEVDLVYRGELFLRGFDTQCREALAEALRARGVRLHFGRSVSQISRAGDDRVVQLEDGPLTADQVLFAIGRRPLTRDIGLAEAGVALSATGGVKVDEAFRTSVPSIRAIGDVIERVALTPVALAEGTVVARLLFGEADPMDYADIPTAVFSLPALGTVGLSEDAAREKFGDIAVYEAHFRPLKYTVSGREERAYMKLVVESATDRVVGCHIVAADAGELVQGIAVALKAGATKAQFDATLGIHPTSAEELVTMRTRSR